MKALTVRQPWATLIAVGAKRYETRSWPTRHRGDLAIHAGLTLDVPEEAAFRLVEKALHRHGFENQMRLPHGQIVAVACLVEVHWAEAIRPRVGREELAFGNLSDGRFAWELAEVRRLDRPVKARGRLGLWEWGDV